MSNTASYIHGITLFNQGHYWHAHEAWELVWLALDGPDRRGLQGLIQTAAALVHWQRGNPRGLGLNWAKARPKLLPLAPRWWGLDLAPLISQMDAMVAGQQTTPPLLQHEPNYEPLT
jgi:predicted metal-dependent hydrolase